MTALDLRPTLDPSRYDAPLDPDVEKALKAFAKQLPSDDDLQHAIAADSIGQVEDWLTAYLDAAEISPADVLDMIEEDAIPVLRERLDRIVPALELLEQLQVSYRAYCLFKRREELIRIQVEVKNRSSRFRRTEFQSSVAIGRGRVGECIAKELERIGWAEAAFYWDRHTITLRYPRRPSHQAAKTIAAAIKAGALRAAAELGAEGAA